MRLTTVSFGVILLRNGKIVTFSQKIGRMHSSVTNFSKIKRRAHVMSIIVAFGLRQLPKKLYVLCSQLFAAQNWAFEDARRFKFTELLDSGARGR